MNKMSLVEHPTVEARKVSVSVMCHMSAELETDSVKAYARIKTLF